MSSRGCGVDAGRDAQEHVLGSVRRGGHFLQQSKLVEAVDDDAANLPLDGLLKLGGGLVAAVEVDLLLREVYGLGDGEFAAGNHVEAEALFGEDAGDGRVDVCLAGVGDGGVGMTAGEGLDEVAAATAEGGFVEDVEGGAELGGEVNGVAAADDEMAGGIDIRGCRGRRCGETWALLLELCADVRQGIGDVK